MKSHCCFSLMTLMLASTFITLMMVGWTCTVDFWDILHKDLKDRCLLVDACIIEFVFIYHSSGLFCFIYGAASLYCKFDGRPILARWMFIFGVSTLMALFLALINLGFFHNQTVWRSGQSPTT